MVCGAIAGQEQSIRGRVVVLKAVLYVACTGECGSLRILDNVLTQLVNGRFSRC